MSTRLRRAWRQFVKSVPGQNAGFIHGYLREGRMPLAKYRGWFDSGDLELLRRVFDIVCRERRIFLSDREQRDDLAAEIYRAFDHGAADEEELLQALSRRPPR